MYFWQGWGRALFTNTTDSILKKEIEFRMTKECENLIPELYGSLGEIIFPDYLSFTHHLWLDIFADYNNSSF